MIQDIGTDRFHNEYRHEKPRPESRVLCFRGREILIKWEDSQLSFLTYSSLMRYFPELAGEETYLFSLDETAFFLFRGKTGEKLARKASEVFEGFVWENIEKLRGAEPREASFAGVTGMQLYRWYDARKFCPRCGVVMEHSDTERMMRCPSCGQMEYPKICPAVIVGVTDGDRLLLTKYAGRSYTRYALIAGFAEIGETIEDTVRREVMEEVGLRVKNIRYYKSQPWSFSDTLLMGFFCELDGEDTIHMDETELSIAHWCIRESVPEDDGVSLTREMMRVFKENRLPVI